jgi:hypothetical protein
VYCVLLFLLATVAVQALGADDSPIALPLEPVFRLKAVGDKQHFITREDFDFERRRSQIEGVSFLAVTTNAWPAGLVPIFAVEKTNRVELRRYPARGQENSSEPLFYALPPEDEPDATKIAGRWECLGVRGTGTKEFFGWDLCVDGENVAGRFDQFTDFRFARIAGGTFRSNQFELRVEYIMDVYVVKDAWRDGRMKGDWTRVDESENGTWEASRPKFILPPANNLVALYEWRRGDNIRRYLLQSEQLTSGWQRGSRPLCRVWAVGSPASLP